MFKPERITAFCDGVVAIAITLLVLGLEVPSVHEVSEKDLPQYLLDSLHPLQGFVVSFLLIGSYWLQHYSIFHYIQRADRIFVGLNGLFLLSLSFVPFPTGLQVAYRHDELALVLYASSQAVCGLSLLAIWSYASRNRRLIADHVSEAAVRSIWWRIAWTPAISLVALATTLVSLEASRLVFVAIPILVLVPHRLVDRAWIDPNTSVRGAPPVA